MTHRTHRSDRLSLAPRRRASSPSRASRPDAPPGPAAPPERSRRVRPACAARMGMHHRRSHRRQRDRTDRPPRAVPPRVRASRPAGPRPYRARRRVAHRRIAYGGGRGLQGRRASKESSQRGGPNAERPGVHTCVVSHTSFSMRRSIPDNRLSDGTGYTSGSRLRTCNYTCSMTVSLRSTIGRSIFVPREFTHRPTKRKRGANGPHSRARKSRKSRVCVPSHLQPFIGEGVMMALMNEGMA